MSIFRFRNFKFGDVHVEGAERIAKVCAAEGVPRFVQVSHLNASATSQSKFYQTKAEGEERVKAAFPTATVMRPGPMYGYEDRLLNNMACESSFSYPPVPVLTEYIVVWSIWWKLNQAETRIRPVHVS